MVQLCWGVTAGNAQFGRGRDANPAQRRRAQLEGHHGREGAICRKLCAGLLPIALAALPGGRHSFASSVPGPSPAILSTKVDTKLIADPSRHIRIEVDYHPNCKPTAESLDRFKAAVLEILPDKVVDIVLDSVIPAERWPKVISAVALDALAQEWISDVALNDGAGQDAVYVLYVPRGTWDQSNAGGERWDWVIERKGKLLYVPGLWISCGALDNGFTPFVSRSALEAFVLTHEFGHALGLVDATRRPGKELPFHCSNKRCLMTTSYDWSLLRVVGSGLPGMRLPSHLCDRCLADIAMAREVAKSASSNAEHGGRLLREYDAKSAFLCRHGRWLEARDLLQEAIARYPDEDELLERITDVLVMTGDVARSREMAKQLLTARNLSSGSTFELAGRLCQLGLYADVLRLIPAARVGQDIRFMRLRAWALEGTTELDVAIRELANFAERRGVDRSARFWAYEELARLCRLAGRLAEAARFHDKPASREQPAKRPYRLQLELVKLEFALRKNEAATRRLSSMRTALEQGFEDETLEPWARRGAATRLAEVEALLGNKAEVERYAASAEALETEEAVRDPDWRLRLARALAIAGDVHESARWLLSMTNHSLPSEPMADPCLDREFENVRQLPEAAPVFLRCAL